ncbi:hypothetical protein COCNU_scaffold013737G000050 [Cocos nucifera]|nr:hypothetical protein [Cocos nucifera]
MKFDIPPLSGDCNFFEDQKYACSNVSLNQHHIFLRESSEAQNSLLHHVPKGQLLEVGTELQLPHETARWIPRNG